MTAKLLLLLAAISLFASPALAGREPPSEGTIGGPELWCVIVVDCNSGYATARFKRVVNCQVQTQGLAIPSQNCPTSEADALWQTLEVKLFDINDNPSTMTPIITKVKNYREDNYNIGGTSVHTVSFDAQVKFWSH